MSFLRICAIGLFAAACAASDDPTGGPPPGAGDEGKGDLPSGGGAGDERECVIDTIQLTDAREAAADLRAAIDPRFVHRFPGAYDRVRVPGALQTRS